ncbi:MAG: tetratricopeptide repeat protein [Gammaproteobacteria bacterium]|nr:tetratricopeptide repeat protein [Gammaproteobacteria bacterium]
MRQINSFAIVLACTGLIGCAASAPSAETAEIPARAMPTLVLGEAAPEIEYGSFTEDQLYQAIISELSAQRGQVTEAGNSYFDLAVSTRDITIIQRAIQFASANSDINALLQLGMLWAQLEPTNPQPQLLLSIQFLESGAFEQAISHMSRVLELGGNMDFAVLSSRTGRLDPKIRTLLIENLRRLKGEFSSQNSIHLTLVQLLAQNGNFEDALTELELLKDYTDPTANTVMLESQILQNMERPKRSMRVMRSGVARFKTDKTLRLSYARMLIQNEEYVKAQEQFQILVEQDPQDWETLYSIALLDTQLENFDRAIASYTKLIGVDQRADESQYNLGIIYQEQDNSEKSIEHFRQVRIGTNNFLSAQQQATRLSIRSGHLVDAHDWLSQLSRGQPRLEVLFTTIESTLLIQEEHPGAAEQLLNTALNKFPNETDLLFARVLYFDSQSDPEGSESDLMQIIRMQPEDSRALNHLGYMLADQTTRHDEALELIERAIAVSPDEPAIIDSLGWALYKVGRHEEALVQMRRAFAAFPDDEVASHLGEVLWALERFDEAMRVWQDALKSDPESPLIAEAMERLQVAE